MSSVSKSAGAVPVHKSKAKAAQTRRGLLYALPDWLMIIVLFFVPIVLLVVMACSRWSLLGGNRGVNFPDNFVKVFENKLFWPSIWFTLEYTVIVTIFLLVLGLGMAMIVQESSKWNNVLRTCFLLPSATGLASASLLFYALYSPAGGPCHQDSELVGPDAGGWFGAGHRPVGPVGHDYRDCLAFLGLLHAADDDRSAGHPR
ncbi:sugar ABC transporter permease [Bifidobacterium longum]|nr:sugar ABC transporter permease [Bifidobacterium longum]